MKRLVLLIVLLVSLGGVSQSQITSHTAYNIKSGTSLPSTCHVGGTTNDVFILTTTDKFYWCISSNTWSSGLGPTAVSPGGSSGQIQYNNSGVFGGVSGATSNGTNTTFGSGNFIATRPKVITSLDDSNGNELFKFTATPSAINEITIANSVAGSGPTISTTGGEADVNLNITPSGNGVVKVGAGLILSPAGILSNGAGDIDTTYGVASIVSRTGGSNKISLDGNTNTACMGDCDSNDSGTRIQSTNGGVAEIRGGPSKIIRVDPVNDDIYIGDPDGSGSSQYIRMDLDSVDNPYIFNKLPSCTYIYSDSDGRLQCSSSSIPTTLTGTSSSIGGGALLAGACASTTVTVTGARGGDAVFVTPNTDPGVGTYWQAYISATNIVTVRICGTIAVTPAASTYSVKVIQ